MADIVKAAQAELGKTESKLKSFMEQLEKQVGGRDRMIMALAHLNNPIAKKMSSALLDPRNEKVSMYEICRQIRVAPGELIKATQEGKLEKSIIEAMTTLAQDLPGIVEKSIDVATTMGPDGFKDRQLLLKMAGMLTEGGGINISMKQQMGSNPGRIFEHVVAGNDRSAQDNPLDTVVDTEVEYE
jgi:hypothetical protein